MGTVVVVGSVNIDLVSHVERHPEPGETLLGSDLVRSPGGKGANQALAAARAGASVVLVGRVGDDADGEAYVAGLRERDVDVGELRTTEGSPTGAALIVVSSAGENTIVVAPGANARLDEADVDAVADTIAAADVLLVQLEVPLECVLRAVEVARQGGTRVVLNPSPVQDLPDTLLDAADPLVVNEHEAQQLGRDDACTTLGSQGATWHGARATPPPVDVVDTTGAGDVFAGTLAAHLASGADDEAALRAAVEASAQATTWDGAQGWSLR